MPPNSSDDPAGSYICQRCTTAALAIVLIGAFFGLAAADRADRLAAAKLEQDSIVAHAVSAASAVLDRDTRLLDRLGDGVDASGPAAQDLLDLAPALVPGVREAAILDDEGTVLAHASAGPGSNAIAAVADEARASLRRFGAPGLFISRPIDDPPNGLIGLARIRYDADGHASGLIVALTDASRLVAPLRLPLGGTLEIRRSDGVALIRTGDSRDAASDAVPVPGYPLAVSYSRPTGEIWRGWRAVWVRNGALVGAVGLMAALAAALFDRGRRRVVETAVETQAREASALRQNVADLAAAARNADEASRAKSRFFAQVTHELRTPLNAIIGFSETIRREMFGPVANQRYIEYAGLIHDAGGHLLSLINDLLDISKLEEGKMEIAPIRVSAAALARSTLDLVELMARERNIDLSAGGVDDCPDLTVDPRAAKQVLVNLLSNAIKFTTPGGRIGLDFAGDGDGVAITVTDTGIGMTPAEIALAFEPFGRATGEQASAMPGTGLGLPIARALVRLHGGELTVSSAPGRGTTVTAFFPTDPTTARPFEVVSAAEAA